MYSVQKILVLVLSVLAIAMPAYATIDGAQLLAQVDKNLAPDSYEMYRKLVNVEPDGRKKEFILFTVKKGRDKIAGLFISPASDKGRTTLRLGENMWLYIPNVGKPVRITSLQSVVGGVFNNSDILQLDYTEEYTVTRVEDQGQKHLLHLKAKTRTVAYDQLRMWVDRQGKGAPHPD
jgi:outer membrane lipoprotein-sorting protein